MESELKRFEMTCPMNGEVCCDGIRNDFKPNKDGKIRQCRLWTAVKGKDPQSEATLDFFDCAWAWMPVVGLEQSQMTRMGTATIQEFRNETHDGFSRFNKAVEQAAIAFRHMAEAQEALIGGIPLPAIENKEQN